MGTDQDVLSGPDFTRGVPLSGIPDGGTLGGHALGKPALLARLGDEVLAIGAKCSHYGGPLNEGLVVGDTVRCPWHHACFSLRTGEAVAPPALNPVDRFAVEVRGERVFVTGEAPAAPRQKPVGVASQPGSVVIVGAGAAGHTAADTLRREGYAGPITMIGSDASPPYDRPNISKDYLAGNAPEEWIPLRPDSWFEECDIRLLTSRTVTAIQVDARTVTLDDGDTASFGALLLATGASPTHLPSAVDHPRVHYLRTLADSRAIIAAAEHAREAVVIGASFIGLEVAASLRARGLAVRVVAPEARPLERVMGAALSAFIRSLHESHGVVFHLEHTARSIGDDHVILDDGTRLSADLVVAGIGVRPNVALAEAASLRVDDGILVDAYLETSARGIFAAGDVARYPDARTGQTIRVEHWVAAQRQGQAAARNILGRREKFTVPPFFWSQHYDVPIAYVGHARTWEEIDVSGNPSEHDCAVTFRGDKRILALATIGRDRASLEMEAAMERQSSSSSLSPEQ